MFWVNEINKTNYFYSKIMDNMSGKRILSFEEFVSNGNDMEMSEPHMHSEMPALPVHEPSEMEDDLAMIDEPESHSEEEGFGMEESHEE